MMELWKNKQLQSLEGEIWKDIPGFEGLYQASSLGRIKSLSTLGVMRTKGYSTRKEKILSQKKDKKTGYLHISLTDENGIRKTFLPHRIIGNLFVPNPENKKEINHKKGIKTDNRASEIEWSTSSENQIHAYSTGLNCIKYGEENHGTCLTNKNVLEIFHNTQSAKEISLLYNVPIYIVYQIKNGKNWSSVTGKTYETKSSRMPKDLVKEIYESDLPRHEILVKYNISSKYLWAIKSGKSWKKLLNKQPATL